MVGGWGQSGGSRTDEKWLDLWHILHIEFIGYAVGRYIGRKVEMPESVKRKMSQRWLII